MCSAHHKIIDDDPITYSVALLMTYKSSPQTSPDSKYEPSDDSIIELIFKCSPKINQASTSGSNIAIANSTISYSGITYSEARNIALDIFTANAISLREDATRVASERASQLITEYIKKLEQQSISPNPLADPDMQHALHSAQRSASRSGNPDLIGILSDLLVDRTKAQDTDLERLVLNESIDIAGRLTPDQFDTLSLIFFLNHAAFCLVTNKEHLEASLKSTLGPLLPTVSRTRPRFQHLQFCGCGAFQTGVQPLPSLLGRAYTPAFIQNIPRELIIQRIIGERERIDEIINHFFTSSDANEHILSMRLTPPFSALRQSISVPPEIVDNLLKGLWGMAAQKCKEIIENPESWLFELNQLWTQNSASFSLTSVGIAIGLTNLRRRGLGHFHLSTWIN